MTEPILESSHNITYFCNIFAYNGLQKHLSSAGLNIWNNRWTNHFDFTPSENSTNYKLSELDGTHISQHFSNNDQTILPNSCVPDINMNDILLSMEEEFNFSIPFTTGKIEKKSVDQILLLFSKKSEHSVLQFLRDLDEGFTCDRSQYWVEET
jgi:hypothetical protein